FDQTGAVVDDLVVQAQAAALGQTARLAVGGAETRLGRDGGDHGADHLVTRQLDGRQVGRQLALLEGGLGGGAGSLCGVGAVQHGGGGVGQRLLGVVDLGALKR